MVQYDAGDFERLGVYLGAWRRFQVRAGDLARYQVAGFVDLDRDRRDLQQRMAVPVEAAGFHVDHHGEVAAEAFGHLAEGGWGGVCFGHHSSLADGVGHQTAGRGYAPRSEEHTSELQSLMRISYAVFCLKKQKDNIMND